MQDINKRMCSDPKRQHMPNHHSWSCETLDALQVLTVAPSIHHGAANTQDDLQVLTVVTSINHVAAKSWMLHKCSLSHQSYIMELRIKWMIDKC